MRKSVLIKAVLILLSVALFAPPLRAQDAKASDTKPSETKPQPEVHYYRLQFVLKEQGDDGRIVNSRTYDTSVSSNGKSSSVRTGTKIPVHTNEKGDIAYLDVGVNLDCYVTQETPQGLSLQITAEISSLASASGGGQAMVPILRQNKWQSMSLIPLGKPTIVFSSDNLENKGRMQVEVTATPIR
jgi:hypothetical protein